MTYEYAYDHDVYWVTIDKKWNIRSVSESAMFSYEAEPVRHY